MYLKPLTDDNKRKIALDRDELIFKAYFIANFKALEKYAVLFVKDKNFAEDIVSETMWRMWHLGSDLIHISSVESYLARSVKNKCLNFLRVKQNIYVSHDELADYNYFDQSCPEQLLISNERIKEIENAIDALPPKTQEAFKLIKDENYSYKEAAEIMGISIKTIDRHIQIATQKLWAILKHKK